MKIKEISPNIKQYSLIHEDSDKVYCSWMDIKLDLDKYELQIMGDCGNYNHRWTATPDSESFVELLIRINGDVDYLLSKISAKNKFKCDESIKETVDCILSNLDCERFDENVIKEIVEDISNIDDSSSEESFYREAMAILELHNVNDSFDLIISVNDYPQSAINTIDIFCNQFIPYLRGIYAKK